MTEPLSPAPPPELVVEWADTIYQQTECDDQRDLYVATRAAQWAADQELEACLEWLEQNQGRWEIPMALRGARRPKPQSLKEQALDELKEWENVMDIAPDSPIRRALEALPE
jgi:hypothetical protein